MREFWGLGNAPINNLLRTVERNGILVSFFDSSSDTNKIDAFTNYLNGIWIIGLSKNTNSVSRLNFSIAHELGHILLHKDIMENNIEVDRNKFNDIEDEANDFASDHGTSFSRKIEINQLQDYQELIEQYGGLTTCSN